MLKIKFLWSNVCVCFHHKNVTLMVVVVSKSLSYKKLMALLTCDITNEEYVLKRWDDCPSTDNLRKILHGVYLKAMMLMMAFAIINGKIQIKLKLLHLKLNFIVLLSKL